MVLTHAESHLTLADVFDDRGRTDEAAVARAAAESVLEGKGFTAAVESTLAR